MGQNKCTESGWAIWNPGLGFYLTTFTDTRQCAIRDHEMATGLSWKACRKDGDKAVKAKLVMVGEKTRAI